MNFNISNFFFDIPIYTSVQIDSSNESTFKQIIDNYNKIEFEGYNPWRKLDSTFIVITDLNPNGSSFIVNGGYGVVKIKCKRYDDIFHYFILWDAVNSKLTKIGQFPSVADFHISEIKQYDKLLSNSNLKEFTKAIGLAANGVGIGSFVYLRRIFEGLIFEAFEKAKNENVVTEESFYKARMDQKIELLKSYLPTFLVENKSLYSILSLGIHELEEKDCLSYFDTLRVGIEIILDEKLEEKKKKDKIEEAKKRIGLIKQEIQK